MIKVYHKINFKPLNPNEVPTDIDMNDYELVAEVNTNNKDVAFDLTQNMDESWSLNQNVTTKSEDARSTSVGDVVVYNGEFFIVDTYGWKSVKA